MISRPDTVVAVLRGAKPGSTVALRAELDALPYTEEVDLSWEMEP